MSDLMTDMEAAVKFTSENQHRHARFGEKAEPEKTITFGSNSGKPRCFGECYDNSMFGRWYQCDKVGRVTLADGSTWCGTHSPAGVAKREAKARERREARERVYEAERAARWEADRRKASYGPMVNALRQIAEGHNAPRALAERVLREAGEI